jgi:hypothetical protein
MGGSDVAPDECELRREDAKDIDSSPSPPRLMKSTSGSGWGNVWIPVDDFAAGKRRTKWAGSKIKKVPVPPRLYVDNRTIIREVGHIGELRRGDHCLIPVNMIRGLSPTIDTLYSWMGSLECVYFYHHFIMVDDVDRLDDQGIPRSREGNMAEIIEYGNTFREAVEEVRVTSNGRWLRFPGCAFKFLTQKCKMHRLPLADYGDNPHIYTVVETRTTEDRERIVKDAMDMVAHPKRYHFLFNNCEHVTELAANGKFTSPEVHFLLWNGLRLMLYVVGLFFLNFIAGCCFSKYCVTYPLRALVAYHVCTSIPVVLQALITYVLVARSLSQHYKRKLLEDDDFWHLMGKELARAVVSGGGATLAISFMPITVSESRYFWTFCAICAFAYLASDLIYNLFCHAVMRLVLIPVWGKVWLINLSGSRRSASGRTKAE